MGTAEIQGELWGQAPHDWASVQEPMIAPLHEIMLDVAMVSKGTRFLDAGCGSGGACVLAANRGAVVSGIDAAEAMIAYCHKRLPTGDFRVGDIELLPFDTETFDTVFAANSVQYSSDRVATLRGFARVCRTGGLIVAGLFGSPEKVAYHNIRRAVVDALPTPPSSTAGPLELSMPGRLESLFQEAGLTVIDSGEVDCPYHYPDIETFWRGILSGGDSQTAMRIIGEDRLKAVLCEAAQAFRADDGSILLQPNVFKFVAATR